MKLALVSYIRIDGFSTLILFFDLNHRMEYSQPLLDDEYCRSLVTRLATFKNTLYFVPDRSLKFLFNRFIRFLLFY